MTKRLFATVVFCLCIPLYAAERTVTIESARTTEYIKTDETKSKVENTSTPEIFPDSGINLTPDTSDQDSDTEQSNTTEMVRFRGDVVIVVTEGSSVSRISADEIIYDKTNDTLEARGNVTYEHTTGKTGSEKFTGEALLFNIKKQEGVFQKGIVTQDTGNKDSDPYIIHAEITGKDSGTTMAFKNGLLTTCDEEDPHWMIRASRIWLLPGNEVAILNGWLFVGPLPLFYIPVFYYPADEMIFHPVFGFRNREGYFIQTTTYLIGRKPLAKATPDSGTSFADFFQSSTLKEQRQHGFFLENLDEDAKSTDSNYLKLMTDVYSSLGGMVGVDGSFSGDGYVKSTSFSVALGFSHTLYPLSSSIFYTSYDTDGNQDWNSGWLFGNELPFRYRTDFSMKIPEEGTQSPFSFSFDLPLISDPKFKPDFYDRSEDLNWFTLLTEQSSLAEGNSVSSETSYAWSLSGSVKPDVAFAKPWLNTFSISSVSGSLTFSSKTNSDLIGLEASYAPDKTFFYPSIVKPQIKLSLSGTLLSSDGTKKTVDKSKDTKSDTGDLENPFVARTDTENKTDVTESPEETTEVNSDEAATTEKEAPIKDNVDTFLPASDAKISSSLQNSAATTYSITWSIVPAYLSEARYDTSEWNSPDDIKWNTFSSVYNYLDTDASLAGKYSFRGGIFSLGSSLDFSDVYKTHPLLSGPSYDTDSEVNTVRLSDYEASVYTVSSDNSLTISPFIMTALFKPISASWKMKNDLVRNTFTGTATDPVWETETFDWDKDYIDAHTASGVLGVSFGSYTEKVTLTSNLPPLEESYTGTGNFAWKYGTLAMTTCLHDDDADDTITTWLWDPFVATLAWSLPFGIKLGQSFTYDIEEDTPSKLNLTASYGPLSLFYTFNNTIPYTLEMGTGWVQNDEEAKFIPSAAGCTFTNTSSPLKLSLWKNRISFQGTINSNVKFNLLKITDSSFAFTPTITLKIYDFLDLSFTSYSTNEVIARYFQNMLDLPEPLPGETNLFTDLLKSFNFFNSTDRESSGFKLKSLSVALTHYLHDWTMNFKVSVTPKLDTKTYTYSFTPTISFVVQWKPISDIKTTVTSKEGVFSLNTASNKER